MICTQRQWACKGEMKLWDEHWKQEQKKSSLPFMLCIRMKSYSQHVGGLLSSCVLLQERGVKGIVARWDTGKVSRALWGWSWLQSAAVHWASWETAELWIKKSAWFLGITFSLCTPPGRGRRAVFLSTCRVPVLASSVHLRCLLPASCEFNANSSVSPFCSQSLTRCSLLYLWCQRCCRTHRDVCMTAASGSLQKYGRGTVP